MPAVCECRRPFGSGAAEIVESARPCLKDRLAPDLSPGQAGISAHNSYEEAGEKWPSAPNAMIDIQNCHIYNLSSGK
jgi:hypothetical protein